MERRGQVTLFIIVAIVIVAAVLVFLLYPSILPMPETAFSPSNYLSTCMKPEVQAAIVALGANGGYRSDEGGVTYNGSTVKYLCYTSEFYKTCVIQQPLIIEHFMKEIATSITPAATTCVQNLKQEYERRGYSVSVAPVQINTSLSLNSLDISFFVPMTITRTTDKGESRTFKQFSVSIDSQLYELLSIATSIIGSESTLGGSETTAYLQYYPNLKIEKTKLSDGSTIYKLSNIITHEEFIFATRSLAWPAGYGS